MLTGRKPSWPQTRTVTDNKNVSTLNISCFINLHVCQRGGFWNLEGEIIVSLASLDLGSIKSPGAFIIIAQVDFSFWKGLGSGQIN